MVTTSVIRCQLTKRSFLVYRNYLKNWCVVIDGESKMTEYILVSGLGVAVSYTLFSLAYWLSERANRRTQ